MFHKKDIILREKFVWRSTCNIILYPISDFRLVSYTYYKQAHLTGTRKIHDSYVTMLFRLVNLQFHNHICDFIVVNGAHIQGKPILNIQHAKFSLFQECQTPRLRSTRDFSIDHTGFNLSEQDETYPHISDIRNYPSTVLKKNHVGFCKHKVFGWIIHWKRGTNNNTSKISSPLIYCLINVQPDSQRNLGTERFK